MNTNQKTEQQAQQNSCSGVLVYGLGNSTSGFRNLGFRVDFIRTGYILLTSANSFRLQKVQVLNNKVLGIWVLQYRSWERL